MTTTLLPIHDAHALVVQTLMRCNTAEPAAAAVARALIGAELAGQDGHGLRRVPAYASQALAGKVDGHATPLADQRRPGALAIDARGGFAYPAVEMALDWLPGAARANGVAIAGIRASHHCGVAGLHVEVLARQGIVALMTANAPASIAPWGGATPLYGTNPIAFAFPVPGAEPAVIDLSVSKVARGKIMAAAQKGEPIPEGWAVDAQGRPTTDSRAAMAGNMLPMGDAKGTALALMIEILAAGITGANFSSESSSLFDAEGAPPGLGHSIIAIDATALSPDAPARMGHMAAMIEGMEGARLPGRRRQQVRDAVTARGIAVDAALMAQIDALGR